MKIGVPKEIHLGEKRVATTPEVIGHLKKLGFEILVEAGAGAGAHFSDAAYSEACLLYTSPSPRDRQKSRMPSSA